jgi:hypothetical protein
VFGLDLGWGTNYTDWVFSWFSSGFPDKLWDTASLSHNYYYPDCIHLSCTNPVIDDTCWGGGDVGQTLCVALVAWPFVCGIQRRSFCMMCEITATVLVEFAVHLGSGTSNVLPEYFSVTSCIATFTKACMIPCESSLYCQSVFFKIYLCITLLCTCRLIKVLVFVLFWVLDDGQSINPLLLSINIVWRIDM